MAMRNVGLLTVGLGVSALVTGVVLGGGDDDDGGSLSSPLMIGGGVTSALGIGLVIWGQARGSSSATALLPLRGGGLVARAWRF
jgi:hypothetical protein